MEKSKNKPQPSQVVTVATLLHKLAQFPIDTRCYVGVPNTESKGNFVLLSLHETRWNKDAGYLMLTVERVPSRKEMNAIAINGKRAMRNKGKTAKEAVKK